MITIKDRILEYMQHMISRFESDPIELDPIELDPIELDPIESDPIESQNFVHVAHERADRSGAGGPATK